MASTPPPATAENLLQFYESALTSNPAYRSREFGVDLARGQRTQVRARLLPQLSASATYSRNTFHDARTSEQNYDGTRRALQGSQSILNLADYFRLRSAGATVLQAEHQREETRMELAGEVIDRYLQVLQAADETRYFTAEKDETASQIKRLRFMRDRQLAKITDLLEVEAYFQELLTNEIEAHNAQAVAMAQLHETSGLRAQQVAPLTRLDFPAVDRSEDDWVADAAKNNGTLIALQQAIEAARNLINSTRSEHLPQVALTFSQTHSNQGFDNRLSPPFDVGTVGLQITIPLFQGGRVSGSTDEAKARYHLAQEEYEQSWRQIERETRTAYLNAAANHARIASKAEEVSALEKVVDAQRKSYQLGVATIVDVLTAQRRLLRSRYDQSKARYEFIRASAVLHLRAGRLMQSDVEEINSWMGAESTH